jgi:uncharacterized protein YcfJ
MLKFISWSIFASLLSVGNINAEDQSSSKVIYQYGTVLSAKPIIEVVKEYQPTKICYEQPANTQKKSDSTGAQVVGGIVGAVIGSKIGKKGGAKVLGATAGAIIGSSIGKEASASNEQPSVNMVCRTENKLHEFEREAGYRVVYLYQGEQFVTELPYNPGNEIKLRVEVAPVFDND